MVSSPHAVTPNRIPPSKNQNNSHRNGTNTEPTEKRPGRRDPLFIKNKHSLINDTHLRRPPWAAAGHPRPGESPAGPGRRCKARGLGAAGLGVSPGAGRAQCDLSRCHGSCRCCAPGPGRPRPLTRRPGVLPSRRLLAVRAAPGARGDAISARGGGGGPRARVSKATRRSHEAAQPAHHRWEPRTLGGSEAARGAAGVGSLGSQPWPGPRGFGARGPSPAGFGVGARAPSQPGAVPV